MSGLDHVADDRLLDLVGGLLERPVAAASIAHVRACAACADRLRTFAATHERAHARSSAVLAEVLPFPPSTRSRAEAGAPSQIVRRSTGPGSARSMFPRRTLAAAASVLVIGGAVLLWAALRPGPRPLEAVAWLPSPDPSILTRDSAVASLDQRIPQGLAAYRNHDAKAARRLLESARADGSLEQVRRVYLGNAQLLTGDARAAIATLSDVNLSLVPEPWQSEAQWSLAEALTRVGRHAEADSLHRLLAERPGEVGERARQALAAPTSQP